MDLFGQEKIEKGAYKLKTSLRYSFSIHDKDGNTSKLLSHLKMSHPTLPGFVKYKGDSIP